MPLVSPSTEQLFLSHRLSFLILIEILRIRDLETELATRLSQQGREWIRSFPWGGRPPARCPKGLASPGPWQVPGGLLEMSHSREISYGPMTCLMDVRVLRILLYGILCILCSPFSVSRPRLSLVLLHGLVDSLPAF